MTGEELSRQLSLGAVAVIGVGIDLVDLARFRAMLDRSPALRRSAFTAGEQDYALRSNDPVFRLAARFAAKEATMKAMSVGLGAFRMVEAEVVRQPEGAPSLRLYGRAADLAASLGIDDWMLSISHVPMAAAAVAIAVHRVGESGAGQSDLLAHLGPALSAVAVGGSLEGSE